MSRPIPRTASEFLAPVDSPWAIRGTHDSPLFCGARMRAIRASLRHLASSDVPVVFQGETGVGKEVLARELHSLSPRSSRPFLKLNCAAVPLELLESELFGYERGAFTGAMANKPGKFELANGGTILLDEIGDMDLKLQAKLLHVPQDNEFQRLGGTETVRVDVRVLAATHRDLRDEISAGRFREDLYYRLNVVAVDVPPLRDRNEEILPLADYFIAKHATPREVLPPLSQELKEALLRYKWPGNVRELENMMRRLLVLGEASSLIGELDARRRDKCGDAAEGRSRPRSASNVLPRLSAVRREQERAELETILSAFALAHWNRKRAAALLNVEYKALLYRMKKLGLNGKNARLREGGGTHESLLSAAPTCAAVLGLPPIQEEVADLLPGHQRRRAGDSDRSRAAGGVPGRGKERRYSSEDEVVEL